MEMQGERRIPAPRQAVWEKLNDPDALKQCIPGCESVEKTSDTEFTAKVRAKVGPVSAHFTGKVTLTDLNPPQGYTISGEGQGGVAGFAKGSAKVALEDEGNETVMRYGVQAQVGGKLAQIGSRLVDAAARKIADDFFTRFNDKLSVKGGAAGHTDGHAEEDHTAGHAAPVPRDPDLPSVSDSTLMFIAAGALVVVGVSLFALL